jgi:hypothetical protein
MLLVISLVNTVISEAEVIDQFFVGEETECILEFQELYRQVMLGAEARFHNRRLKVEGQPFLNSAHSCAACEIHKQS